MRLRPESRADRDTVIARMQDAQIGCSVHFKAIHLYDHYRSSYGLPADALPVAARLSATSLSLPLFPAMTESDVEHVASTLTGIVA